MDKDILFKKATFGGFDKEDVMNYIAKITDEFQAYKTRTIKTIDTLKEKVEELEESNKELQEHCDQLNAEMMRVQEADEEKTDQSAVTTDEIKSIIESLYENINGFMSSLSGGKDEAPDKENSEEHSENEFEDDELLKIIDKYVD